VIFTVTRVVDQFTDRLFVEFNIKGLQKNL